jgi:hypothetical protein
LCIATHEQVAQAWTSGGLTLSASSTTVRHDGETQNVENDLQGTQDQGGRDMRQRAPERDEVIGLMVYTPAHSARKTVSPVFSPESPLQAAQTVSTRSKTPLRQPLAATAVLATESIHNESPGHPRTAKGAAPTPPRHKEKTATGMRRHSQQAGGGRIPFNGGEQGTHRRGIACGSPPKYSQGKAVRRSGGRRVRTPPRQFND